MTHGLFIDLIINMIIKAMDSSSNTNVVEIFANCGNVSMPTLLSNLHFFYYQQGIQLSVSALQYPPFFVDPCLFMNGGCASFCESDNFVVTCSCEPGYDIQPDGSCTANRKELCRLGGQKFDTKLLKCVGRYLYQ